jgi:indolepyruvate ferredoxin oxidoreductase beta subunit
MEALRYLPYLGKEGWVITSSNPSVNIPNYPELDSLNEELSRLPKASVLPIEDMAKDNGVPKSANIILLGMAAKYLDILTPEQLKESIRTIFASKGDATVEMNCKAFEIGLNA